MGNMLDYLIVQAFDSFFIYNMYEVLQDAYGVPPYIVFSISWLYFCTQIFFSKKWFDNRKQLQSLQTEFRLLRKEFGNLKKDITTLTNICQSAEVLLNTVRLVPSYLQRRSYERKQTL